MSFQIQKTPFFSCDPHCPPPAHTTFYLFSSLLSYLPSTLLWGAWTLTCCLAISFYKILVWVNSKWKDSSAASKRESTGTNAYKKTVLSKCKEIAANLLKLNLKGHPPLFCFQLPCTDAFPPRWFCAHVHPGLQAASAGDVLFPAKPISSHGRFALLETDTGLFFYSVFTHPNHISLMCSCFPFWRGSWESVPVPYYVPYLVFNYLIQLFLESSRSSTFIFLHCLPRHISIKLSMWNVSICWNFH